MSETISIHKNNLSSYCGLVDAKIRASDKDLPVSHGKMTHFEQTVDPCQHAESTKWWKIS